MKYLLTLFAVWVLSMISLAAQAATDIPFPANMCVEDTPINMRWSYNGKTGGCSTPRGCITGAYPEWSVGPDAWGLTTYYRAGDMTGNIKVGDGTLQLSFRQEHASTTGGNSPSNWTESSVIHINVLYDCGQDFCSELAQAATFQATYDSNSYNLMGCIAGCQVTSDLAGTGSNMAARKIYPDGKVQASSKYTGQACTGSDNAQKTGVPLSLVVTEKLGALDPTLEVFKFEDPENNVAVEYDKEVINDDVENTVTTINPPDQTADVVSSTDTSGAVTSSVVDNEPKSDIDKITYPDVARYQIFQENGTGNTIISNVDVHNNGTAATGGSGGDGDGSGGGDGDGDGDGSGDVDLSGVLEGLSGINESLGDLLDQASAGDVTFSGSCIIDAPTCDDSKPFCQQLKASYKLKCDDFQSDNEFITQMGSDPFPDGGTELSKLINILPSVQAITGSEITGSCPSFSTININIGGYSKSLQLDAGPYCDFAQLIRPMILFIGIFMVIRIVSRS